MTLHTLELKISRLLRAGVLIAGLFIFIGWMWDISVAGDQLTHFKDYHSVGLLDSIRECVSSGRYGLLVTYFGLTVLVLLPVARVLLTGVLFVIQKERVLGFIALFVFAVLVASFSLGINIH